MASIRRQAQFASQFAKSGRVAFPKGTTRVEAQTIRAKLKQGKTPAQANRASQQALKGARAAGKSTGGTDL